MSDTIDLHCHLLPGLDDGARDLGDAVAMARQAQADGIGAICATPHIRVDHAVVIAELPARRAQLSAALLESGCTTRVLAGGEVAADMLGRLDDRDLKAVTLGGGGRWVLLEPPAGPLDDRFEAAVHTLHARGFRALIAHPERHPGADLIARLARLVARGALVQATAAYFADPRTRSDMVALAEAGVIHVLGSDAHSSRAGRRVELVAAFESLRTVEPIGPHLGWVARVAPSAIVEGSDPVCPFSTERITT
ncbi:MAG TPA: CpsB/CapC family capsule biosynthesis tyrosine phosphatase [Solirubrobacteraceae bacterium]|nr:CpsB/CapC family capsule biosynthesis tyrosine phosphatase [Solirubrobacteraceae bacterium]